MPGVGGKRWCSKSSTDLYEVLVQAMKLHSPDPRSRTPSLPSHTKYLGSVHGARGWKTSQGTTLGKGRLGCIAARGTVLVELDSPWRIAGTSGDSRPCGQWPCKTPCFVLLDLERLAVPRPPRGWALHHGLQGAAELHAIPKAYSCGNKTSSIKIVLGLERRK